MTALLDRLQRRVDNLVARAIVRVVDDSRRLQGLQVEIPRSADLAPEVHEACERFEDYGFTSVPLPGAEAVGLFVGGFRTHPMIVSVADRRYRLKNLQPGEVAIYTDQGDKIVIKRGGTIEVHASTKVEITSPLVTMSGDLEVAGTITADDDVVADGISLTGHRHGGVQTGGAQTGTPV